jgi:thiol-disulfide isomerase/thioredoxin
MAVKFIAPKSRSVALITALFLALATSPAQAAAVQTPYSFSATTVTGAKFNGVDLAGKPTVMWFWAPWCTICRAESPDLVALAKTYKNKINLIGVAGLGSLKEMKGFVSDTHTGGIIHLADVNGRVWNHFGVVSQPTLVFISAKGKLYRHVGALQKSDLFALTKSLIKGA